jgi:hypothetical protein
MRARDRPEDGWVEAKVRLEAGRRQRPALRGLETAAQRAGRGSYLGGKRKKGEGVEVRKEGTTEADRGAAGTLYPGQAARGHVA